MATDKARQWKIRDAEGNIFGPATIDTLVKWARDGRLSADQSATCDDGANWRPVDSFPELEMDWAAELAPGKFFGPVNRDAMKEFIRNGDVSEDMAQFVRVKSIEESPVALREENASLKVQIERLRADFAERTGKLESELAAAEAEKRMAAGELSTRDLDFDAERQAFAAEKSRMDAERQALAAEKSKLKAEVAKAEKRAEVLAAQVAEAESRSRSREADLARIAELEKKVAEAAGEIRRLKAELDNQEAAARRRLKDTETKHLAETKELEARLREARNAAEAVTALRKREDAARRLASQLATMLSAPEKDDIAEADAVIVEQQ